MNYLLLNYVPFCLVFCEGGIVNVSNSLVRKQRDVTVDLLSFFGFFNDAQGLYQTISKTDSDETLQQLEMVDAELFKVRDRVKNITARVQEEAIRTRYFEDEQVITDCQRLLKLYFESQDSQSLKEFINKSKNIQVNVMHLLDGMLGIYKYGGDLLSATVDILECHPRLLRESVATLMTPIKMGFFIYTTRVKMENSIAQEEK